MKKKLLSVLICMTMSVGMLPTMAYAAEEGTEFGEQQVTIPEKPAATSIPTSYVVSCEEHGSEMMNLNWDTLTIGDVTENGDSYVCLITIATAAYAEAYSADHGKHTAAEESITYNMTWTGSEWKAPELTQLPAINVVCEKEVVPEAPAATSIPTSYIVACEDHEAAQMNLLPDTFTIGEVTKDGDSYVCPITIVTAAYAEAYSAENGKHTAVAETITYNMTWTGSEWKAPEMTELPVINVVCEKEVVPEAPVESELAMGYMVNCKNSFFHRARFIYQLPETVSIGEVEKKGDNYVCEISVSTKAYADAYSREFCKRHTAVKSNITYNMTWDGEQWKAPAYSNLPTIEVECARRFHFFPFVW